MTEWLHVLYMNLMKFVNSYEPKMLIKKMISDKLV